MATSYGTAVRLVLAKTKDGGIRLSELQGIQRRVAERMIDRGDLHAVKLPNGDYLIERK